jgi:hypothetical protein
MMDTWCLDCRGSLRLDNYNNVNGSNNGLRMGKKRCSGPGCVDGYVKAKCSNCSGKGMTGWCGDCRGRGWVEGAGVEGSEDGWVHVDRWVNHVNGVSGQGGIEGGVGRLNLGGNEMEDDGVWVGGFVTDEKPGWGA